jgi:propionate CoA-transferase
MKVITAEEAAALVEDGQTVTVSGLLGNMVPEVVLQALEQRFLETGHPRGLTEIHPWLYGVDDGTGLNRWAHDGFLKRIIGSTYILPSLSKTSEINAFILADRVEGYIVPANAIFQTLRATAAGRPGFLTNVGIDTFADPRRDGCRINKAAKEDIPELVTLGGEEQLFYKSLAIDVALIRASTADTEGNLFCEDEGLTQGILLQATAAQNSGGVTIAQVKRVVEAGTLHPLMVEVPGAVVDYVVVHPEGLQLEYGKAMGNMPATTGAYRLPVPEIEYWPPGADKIIARRALMELEPGQLVNVGGGIPGASMPRVAYEEQMNDIRWSVEHGVFGGFCLSMLHWNPTAITTPAWLLDFYNGGGLDVSALGFVQLDRFGNTNVGRFGDQLPGPGGFTDIAHGTRKMLFCGTFMADGLDVDASDGTLRIVREGSCRKFLNDVEMVCFSGREALRKGQDVLYVTERAVFRLVDDGLLLEEIAPGVDCQSQVLALSEFSIKVSSRLKLMDERLFRLEPMFLGVS